MAIQFGTDGTLYCNSIKRNWIAATNLIGYGCGTGFTTGTSGQDNWTRSGTTSQQNTEAGSTGNNCYENTRIKYCYGLTAVASSLKQSVYLIKNHKYYLEFYYCNYSATRTGSYTIGSHGASLPLSSTWTKFQYIYTHTGSTGTSIFEVNTGTYCNYLYVTGIKLIDLTANTPSCDVLSDSEWLSWCNKYMRESRTFGNPFVISTSYRPRLTTVSSAVTSSTYNAGVASGGNSDWGYFKECYRRITLANTTFYLRSGSTFSTFGGTNGIYAQIYADQHSTASAATNRIDFGGQASSIPIIRDFTISPSETPYVLVSGHLPRNTSSGAYFYVRTDGNTSTSDYARYAEWANLLPVDDTITSWNNYHITSEQITYSQINANTDYGKQFFDCWYDGYTQPMIHIPEPSYNKVKFNTNYDIECSDVIVEPWSNSIYFDEAGRIHCKKLQATEKLKPMG